MPRARKRTSDPAPEQDAVHRNNLMDTDAQPLQFDEPLTWRAGRPIAVSDLLRRLQALYEELRDTEQEDAHRDSLTPKAQELASPLLLGHKDKGIRAYSLLCIVEMFRLLAPDAPYNGGQLKEIFNLFVSTIIPALANPSDPYNTEHHNILVSLTTVKSIILLTDIPGSDNLILSLFSNCFDVLSGNIRGSAAGVEQVGKNIEFHMTGMLCTLVDECETLPGGVMEIILAQFLRADPNAMPKGKKAETQASPVLREVSSAYNMARSVCNSCAERMVRHIGQYFSAVLIDASQSVGMAKGQKSRGRKRTYDESEDEAEDGLAVGPSEDELQEAEKAHRLLRELWRSCPDTIRNVVSQIEAEVGADNVQLRVMAVQTVGDMIAGIGAAGPPPSNPLDPGAYPSQSLDNQISPTYSDNVLLIPDAPHAFSSVYPSAYNGFVDRHRDKSAQVRSAWVTEAGRILFTNGGGKGLDTEQESSLLRYLSDMLVDQDEKVRLAAVQAVANFDFDIITQKLGGNGSITTPASVLCNLADRIKDTKHHVRVAAMELLARIWGVAAGAITEGGERTRELLGPIPSKIFDAVYINDRTINALVLEVLFDSLLPIAYPPIKSKAPVANDLQNEDNGQNNTERAPEPDRIRVERILTLVRDLDEKAKAVFFAWQQQQVSRAKYMTSILQHNEALNSAKGAPDESRQQRDTLIKTLSNFFPEPATAMDHLTRLIKHDRRNYALMRFCFSPESDYRKVVNAMKELIKRIEQGPGNLSAILETVVPFMRSASILIYNRSHVSVMLEISRSDEHGLGSAAHDVIKDISSKAPSVFKVHIKELCESLQKQAPTAAKPNDLTAVDSLKACAGFAQRFPEEMPKDRDFYKALTQFAMYGMPPDAAKHAVTVIVTSSETKQRYIKEILRHSTKNFDLDSKDSLPKLAALSQLRLLAYDETEDLDDTIMEIAVVKVLSHNQQAVLGEDIEWSDDIDDLLHAKLWALKILVNGLRGRVKDSQNDQCSDELRSASVPVFKLLNTLIEHEGEMSQTTPTPTHHKSRLRLAAAMQILKLCYSRPFERLFEAPDFNRLTNIAQDTQPQVRSSFVNALKKYLGQNKLSHRFYALVFLYAFEPTRETKDSTTTWLKARAAFFSKRGETVMEAVFARFMSLLVHHQDFSPAAEDLEDFVEYIMFYLKTVATQANLPQVYNIAQRLKTVQDGIDPSKSVNLYILSDLAEATIRQFQEFHGWSLQLLPGKTKLPIPIFAQLANHAEAQRIAEKRFIPEQLVETLEDLVKSSMKTRKRKAEGSSASISKRSRSSKISAGKSAPVRPSPRSLKGSKTNKPPKQTKERAASTVERRKSSRNLNTRSYAENDDSEDDNELESWQAAVRAGSGGDDGEGNKETAESSTPPTSESTPAPPDDRPPGKRKKFNSHASTPSAKAKRLPVRGSRPRRVNEKDSVKAANDSDGELSEVPSEVGS